MRFLSPSPSKSLRLTTVGADSDVPEVAIIRAMRFSLIPFVLVLGVLCQGCVVFPYSTPEVKGSVIDANTRQPIAAAKIVVHNHINIHCTSAADGSFDLRTGDAWRPCFLMPGDAFVIWADVSFKAQGYQTVTKRYSALAHGSVVLERPIELQNESQPTAASR